MLTGRLVFRGDTVSDTIVAILQGEPDWSALPSATPLDVDRILRRCLEKDAKRRLRDIGEARIELDEAAARPTTEAVPVPAPDDRSLRWRAFTIGALVVAVVAALALALWPRRAPQSDWSNPLENAQFTRFTDFPGTETLANISPDGKFVAFFSDRDGSSTSG
jgi:hypothetical protein